MSKFGLSKLTFIGLFFGVIIGLIANLAAFFFERLISVFSISPLLIPLFGLLFYPFIACAFLIGILILVKLTNQTLKTNLTEKGITIGLLIGFVTSFMVFSIPSDTVIKKECSGFSTFQPVDIATSIKEGRFYLLLKNVDSKPLVIPKEGVLIKIDGTICSKTPSKDIEFMPGDKVVMNFTCSDILNRYKAREMYTVEMYIEYNDRNQTTHIEGNCKSNIQ